MAIVILLLATALVLLILGAFNNRTPEEKQRIFSTVSLGHLFTDGEVKHFPAYIPSFILSSASIEGRILELPMTDVNGLTSVMLSFKTKSGDIVEVNAILGQSDDLISVVVADRGLLVGNEEHNARPISQILPLLREGDPVQIKLRVQEITGKTEAAILVNPLCEDRSELCAKIVSETQEWFNPNNTFINSIESGETLPQKHNIGRITEVVIFNGE